MDSLLAVAILTVDSLLLCFPLLAAVSTPSVGSDLAWWAAYVPMLLAVGFVFVRVADGTNGLVGSVALLEGTAALSSGLPILLGFALLELVSLSFRSISLGLRFGCNIVAGHVLMHLLAGAAMVLHIAPELGAILIARGLVALFETAVCCVQNGVFSILVTTYVYL